ncbi:hypothetical protein BSKO_02684 [Bryopsis sp. KO-2023]|nr:hypothetical protein BSKO_02684 [Bryopsis sp. KO-2023]
MGVDLKDAKEALDMMEVDLEVAKKELIGIKKVLMVAKMDLEEEKEELNQIVATAYPHHAATLTSLRSMLSEAFFYVQINTEYEQDQARADRVGVVGNWHFIRKAIEASETFDSVYHRYSKRYGLPPAMSLSAGGQGAVPTPIAGGQSAVRHKLVKVLVDKVKVMILRQALEINPESQQEMLFYSI